jgi:hypothetical protein
VRAMKWQLNAERERSRQLRQGTPGGLVR